MINNVIKLVASLFQRDNSRLLEETQIDPMPLDEFWEIIGTHPIDHLDADAEMAELQEKLENLSVEKIIAFELAFNAVAAASYTWDLWGAAYVINGGCSDDNFDYFRSWLISRGQSHFERAVANPDLIFPTNSKRPEATDFEDIQYVAMNVWSQKTKAKSVTNFIQLYGSRKPTEPSGSEFDEDSEYLRKRYPNLWAKFGEDPL